MQFIPYVTSNFNSGILGPFADTARISTYTKKYHPITVCYFIIAFIVWANDELEYFVSKFARQVFHCDITLAAIGICVGIATRHCNKVRAILMLFSVLNLTNMSNP